MASVPAASSEPLGHSQSPIPSMDGGGTVAWDKGPPNGFRSGNTSPRERSSSVNSSSMVQQSEEGGGSIGLSVVKKGSSLLMLSEFSPASSPPRSRSSSIGAVTSSGPPPVPSAGASSSSSLGSLEAFPPLSAALTAPKNKSSRSTTTTITTTTAASSSTSKSTSAVVVAAANAANAAAVAAAAAADGGPVGVSSTSSTPTYSIRSSKTSLALTGSTTGPPSIEHSTTTTTTTTSCSTDEEPSSSLEVPVTRVNKAPRNNQQEPGSARDLSSSPSKTWGDEETKSDSSGPLKSGSMKKSGGHRATTSTTGTRVVASSSSSTSLHKTSRRSSSRRGRTSRDEEEGFTAHNPKGGVRGGSSTIPPTTTSGPSHVSSSGRRASQPPSHGSRRAPQNRPRAPFSSNDLPSPSARSSSLPPTSSRNGTNSGEVGGIGLPPWSRLGLTPGGALSTGPELMGDFSVGATAPLITLPLPPGLHMRVDALVSLLQPNRHSEAIRWGVYAFLCAALRPVSGKVTIFGSWPLKTYLPDSDLDIALIVDPARTYHTAASLSALYPPTPAVPTNYSEADGNHHLPPSAPSPKEERSTRSKKKKRGAKNRNKDKDRDRDRDPTSPSTAPATSQQPQQPQQQQQQQSSTSSSSHPASSASPAAAAAAAAATASSSTPTSSNLPHAASSSSTPSQPSSSTTTTPASAPTAVNVSKPSSVSEVASASVSKSASVAATPLGSSASAPTVPPLRLAGAGPGSTPPLRANSARDAGGRNENSTHASSSSSWDALDVAGAQNGPGSEPFARPKPWFLEAWSVLQEVMKAGELGVEDVRQLAEGVLERVIEPGVGSGDLHGGPNDGRASPVAVAVAAAESAADAMRSGPRLNPLERKFTVTDLTFIDAEVKILKFFVDGIPIDVSANAVNGLASASFLEEVDRLVGKDNLFKRSIILLKAWSHYEAGVLASHRGLLSTYALEVMLLYIFNSAHEEILSPLDALRYFLQYFTSFPWESAALTVWGPVPLEDLDTAPAPAELVPPSQRPPQSILTPELIAKYATVPPPPAASSGPSSTSTISQQQQQQQQQSSSVPEPPVTDSVPMEMPGAPPRDQNRLRHPAVSPFNGLPLAPSIHHYAPDQVAADFRNMPAWATQTRELASPHVAVSGFHVKHINIVDPLNGSNNLGRSVSRPNFFELRRAFGNASRALHSVIVSCIQLGDHYPLDTFFRNSWRRQNIDVDAPFLLAGGAGAMAASMWPYPGLVSNGPNHPVDMTRASPPQPGSSDVEGHDASPVRGSSASPLLPTPPLTLSALAAIANAQNNVAIHTAMIQRGTVPPTLAPRMMMASNGAPVPSDGPSQLPSMPAGLGIPPFGFPSPMQRVQVIGLDAVSGNNGAIEYPGPLESVRVVVVPKPARMYSPVLAASEEIVHVDLEGGSIQHPTAETLLADVPILITSEADPVLTGSGDQVEGPEERGNGEGVGDDIPSHADAHAEPDMTKPRPALLDTTLYASLEGGLPSLVSPTSSIVHPESSQGAQSKEHRSNKKASQRSSTSLFGFPSPTMPAGSVPAFSPTSGGGNGSGEEGLAPRPPMITESESLVTVSAEALVAESSSVGSRNTPASAHVGADGSHPGFLFEFPLKGDLEGMATALKTSREDLNQGAQSRSSSRAPSQTPVSSRPGTPATSPGPTPNSHSSASASASTFASGATPKSAPTAPVTAVPTVAALLPPPDLPLPRPDTRFNTSAEPLIHFGEGLMRRPPRGHHPASPARRGIGDGILSTPTSSASGSASGSAGAASSRVRALIGGRGAGRKLAGYLGDVPTNTSAEPLIHFGEGLMPLPSGTRPNKRPPSPVQTHRVTQGGSGGILGTPGRPRRSRSLGGASRTNAPGILRRSSTGAVRSRNANSNNAPRPSSVAGAGISGAASASSSVSATSANAKGGADKQR